MTFPPLLGLVSSLGFHFRPQDMEKELIVTPCYSRTELSTYFLKLGTWGFGGPVALVGYMHRDLVENKK